MRLNRLLAESVRAYVTVVDEQRLRSAAPEGVPHADAMPIEVLAFRTMRARPLPMAALGLAALERQGLAPRHEEPGDGSAFATRATVRLIDREFYTRSRAYYEASFKTLT